MQPHNFQVLYGCLKLLQIWFIFRYYMVVWRWFTWFLGIMVVWNWLYKYMYNQCVCVCLYMYMHGCGIPLFWWWHCRRGWGGSEMYKYWLKELSPVRGTYISSSDFHWWMQSLNMDLNSRTLFTNVREYFVCLLCCELRLQSCVSSKSSSCLHSLKTNNNNNMESIVIMSQCDK